MAFEGAHRAKKSRPETDTVLSKPAANLEPGFIVINLGTDGLISKTWFGTRIPQILQIGFAPLDELAQSANTVSFYTQPVDSEAFNRNLKNNTYLNTFYSSYSEGSYVVKQEGMPDHEVDADPLIDCINILVRWKQKLYKNRPVYLIAHNALKYVKVILNYHLEALDLFDSFRFQMNFAGWIDSLLIIRGMPDILIVLGYPLMTEYDRWKFIQKEWPFALKKLVKALSKQYAKSSKSGSNLKWPVFRLSCLDRTEKENEWLHHFSRDVMIHNCRDMLKEIMLHRSHGRVMALVCILQQLNLYPKFREAHFERDYDVITP